LDVQLPLEHASPAAHWIPQVPQLLGSTFVSTQTFPHCVLPPPQLVAHVPAEQSSPCLHAAAHAPQLSWSFFVSVHAPPQSSCPVVQAPPSPLSAELVVELLPQPPCATTTAASIGNSHCPTTVHGRSFQTVPITLSFAARPMGAPRASFEKTPNGSPT
jgi:hypothetical protein